MKRVISRHNRLCSPGRAGGTNCARSRPSALMWKLSYHLVGDYADFPGYALPRRAAALGRLTEHDGSRVPVSMDTVVSLNGFIADPGVQRSPIVLSRRRIEFL